MTTAAIIGSGTTFSGAALGALAELLDVSGPEVSVSDVDATSMGSTDNFEESIPGLANGGEVTLELNFLKASVTALYAAIRVVDTFTITLPDGSTNVFSGYLKGIGQKTPVKDKITVSATFKVTGKPAFTAAA